jgi:hypothetical protein
MPDLGFSIESAEAMLTAAAPHLMFRLRIAQTPERGVEPIPIHCVLLQIQVRIEPALRDYDPRQQDRLFELFGAPALWDRTVRSLLWTQCGITVPSFTGVTAVALPVACSYDFSFAVTRYFHALADDDGDVHVSMLFSGTVFYADAVAGLQAAPIGWDRSASFRLPVHTWQRAMDAFCPGGAWLCIARRTLDRLCNFKNRHPLMTWDQALDLLLARAGEDTES